MGNTQFLDSKLIQDETYGLVSKFTYDETLVIQKNLDISQNKTEIIQMTQLHQSLTHKNLIKIHKYELETETIQIYMEYFENTLAKDISQRKLKNLYYHEHELLSLLDQLISVGAYLQENSIYHDDIRPQNIFLQTNGTIKLTHSWLIENQLQRYYAPEQYESNQLNHYKLSVFSLGMTMLNLMTLTSMDLCYQKNSVNLSLINEILHSTLYSYKLINKVTVLLAGPNNRPDFITTQNQIPKLSNKLFQVSPRQQNNQRYICRQIVKSPISPHSHSPFTFRGVIVQPSLVQVKQPQQIQQIQQLPQQLIQNIQIPQLLSQIQPQLQPQQQQQQINFQRNSPTRQSTRSSERSPVTPVKSDLDKRIQRAIILTNETLKKNSMIQ